MTEERPDRNVRGNTLKRCFLSVLIIGFAAHAAGMSAGLSFHDDVVSTYDVGATHIFGRFTLGLLGKITRVPFGGSNYSLPWFNGLISLLFIAGFGWLVVRLLDIRNAVLQVLVCGVLVTFPVVTATFAYMFTAPYYMFALLLCGISAGLLTGQGHLRCGQGLWRTAAGALIMALLTGIYQAYLPVLLTLEILILMKEELAGKEQAAKRWIRAFCGTVCGLILYLILMRISLRLTGKELFAYRGLDSLGTGGSSYPERILWAYRIFFSPESFVEKRHSTDYLMFMWSMAGVYRIVIVLGMILLAAAGIRMLRNGCRPAAMARYAVLAAVFPLFVNFIYVMMNFDVYGLMVYAQVFVFILPLMLADTLLQERRLIPRKETDAGNGVKGIEEGTEQQKGRSRVIHALALAAALLSAYSVLFYCRYDNLCYYKAARMQENAIAWDEILISRIQETEGYDPSLPVVFLNQTDKDVNGWEVDPELQKVMVTPYGVSELINDYAWVDFMRIHCGWSPAVQEDDGSWSEYVEEEDMPHYPAQGSIRIVDRTVVVNF